MEAWQSRFITEYKDLKDRCIKLGNVIDNYDSRYSTPKRVLVLQLEYMEKYLSILEARAKIENIDLT